MDRRPIHQLSESLVNRIAAGEVIERPAAVVKELVENAIDAGASRIQVEIEDGGRSLIRVVDDGCGMDVSDLPLAFAPHATSKLSCDDDLFRITTMGFRGEALASVGSVAQARILSRTRESDVAYEVINRGGLISGPQAAAGNAGTLIEVRNLFFNTPARRKFIKGAATEFGHISETLVRLALPHPRIAFGLSHNGRVTFELPATPDDSEQRLLRAWPREFHEQRLPLLERDGEIRLSGIVGLPELARPTAKYQYLYLNGRIIRDRFIQHALREAYRGLTEPGRYPAAVLLLELPPGDVDVNVHPTKVEVRFRDSGRVHGLVIAAVRERLLGSDLSPRAVPNPREDREDLGQLRQKLAGFFKQGLKPAPPCELDSVVSASPAAIAGAKVNDFFLPPALMPTPRFEYAFSRPAAPVPAEVSAVDPPDSATGVGAATFPPGVPAIQLHNSYLVAQSDDGLVIIDQHALHERIMYEELLARLNRGTLESQRLLIPQVVEVASSQVALLEQIQPLLARLGIEVSAFGPASVAVHAFPTFLQKLEPATFVRELLERGEQELLDLHEEEVLHEVLDMMACKAAVKAGDPLSPAEIETLLARRELVERSSNCPHGRPTTLRLSLRDLEKQFKRTGF